MITEHRARITWSDRQLRAGLPAISETVDPAWLYDATSRRNEGWSLVCRFDPSPQEQGNPTLASVHFLMDDAPHDRLEPGARLRLFERATGDLALVEIVE